jgi:hypothetical protein
VEDEMMLLWCHQLSQCKSATLWLQCLHRKQANGWKLGSVMYVCLMVFDISKVISVQVVQVVSHFFLHLNLSEFHPTHPRLVLAISTPKSVMYLHA